MKRTLLTLMGIVCMLTISCNDDDNYISNLAKPTNSIYGKWQQVYHQAGEMFPDMYPTGTYWEFNKDNTIIVTNIDSISERSSVFFYPTGTRMHFEIRDDQTIEVDGRNWAYLFKGDTLRICQYPNIATFDYIEFIRLPDSYVIRNKVRPTSLSTPEKY